MHKRFTIKFVKYIFIFFIITMFLTGLSIYIFFSSILKDTYSSLKDIDESYISLNLKKNNNNFTLSKDLQRKLYSSDAKIYILDDKDKVLYPKNTKGFKSLVISNIQSSFSIPYEYNNKVVIIYPDNNKINISNSDEIDTGKLIDSIYIKNFNKYQYLIKDEHLLFFENKAYKPFQNYSDTDLFGDNVYSFLFKVFISLILINLFMVIFLATIISKKLSKPLFFYTEWIENLSKGRLFKPSSKFNNKKNTNLYKELNFSVQELNNQLIKNKLYNNQLKYYRNKWISQISHDLKSPLTSIFGYSRLLSIDKKNAFEYAELISNKADYMANLIQSLNKNFEIETEQMKINKEKFNISSCIYEIINSLKYKKILITDLLDEENFYGNKLFFQRMFTNLIENSIDHNSIHPNIDILLYNTDDTLIIEYKDNGMGIKENEIIKSLNFGHTSKSNSSNHGIGFTVILDAIKYHSGVFEPLTTNQGVHFIIKLPLNN
ncbi:MULTISPECIES: HAMP domain-containing sensor histidine kinase [Staphylococcaceae]|uniref:HAMP domain-containing sensor histidine kinase n=1 Tax=Staphylococcaceae TaxID=90964 RepID=UPI0018694A2E|nr:MULTISPECIES: HAMP domain-containing sensor histidine kinase [Staphylococcaceae]